MKKFLLIFIGVCTLSFNTQAQDQGFESILFASTSDANKLVNAYINPAMKGLIFSMNNGWYHTAKVHKKFGFDITIGLSGALVPSKDEMFAFSGLGLSSQVSANTATAPTVAGGKSSSTVTVTIPANSLPEINNGNHPALMATFRTPNGVKEDLPANLVPAPAVQLNLGLPFKLEGMLRFVPRVGSNDVKGELLGVGLKKEITSWFGPMTKTPLHVSLLAAYTNMKVTYDLQNEINNNANISGRNANSEFKLNAYTVQAIASLNFPFINIYGGFGYGSGSSTLNVNGTYNLSYTPVGGGASVTRTLNNPIRQEFDASGFKTTLGARISLGFFKIFADYSFQDYNTVSAGIALGFR